MRAKTWARDARTTVSFEMTGKSVVPARDNEAVSFIRSRRCGTFSVCLIGQKLF